MARLSFTENLKRHLPCPPVAVDAATLRELLERVFDDNPPLRSYLLDDQNRLRKHVTIFVNDAMIKDRASLCDALMPDDEVFIFQALSGG